MKNDLQKISSARLPTAYGAFTCHAFRNELTNIEHLVLSLGDIAGESVLIRFHSECLTGDAFGSMRCNCGDQLQQALKKISIVGRGALIYLRGQEGRGIGLCNKIRAYQLQDQGLDTVEANEALDLPIDNRDYKDAKTILDILEIKSIKLMSNNPAKITGSVALTHHCRLDLH